MAGHQGYAKTVELVYRDYVWVGMSKDIRLTFQDVLSAKGRRHLDKSAMGT
jgi:hypothetical protein